MAKVPEGKKIYTAGKVYKAGEECPDNLIKKSQEPTKIKSDYKKSGDDE